MAFVGFSKASRVLPQVRFGHPQEWLARFAAWRAERQLQQAADRLRMLSPHLLADIGVEFVPDDVGRT